jgi:hypothetical protein
MGNEEYFLTINGVVAIVHVCRIVPRDGVGQVGITESYAFCLLPAETPGTISNVKAAFG